MRKSVKYTAISTLAALIAVGLLIYWPYSTTVVLVVRHAERNDPAPECAASPTCPLPTSGNRANPPLLPPPAGQIARADTLAHVVEDTGIQAIYASCFCRTQLTVEPTANKLGLTTNLVSQHASDGSVDVTNLIAQINTNNVGQKVLVAGHSDTVGAIIAGLGGGTIDSIESGEFDNLYVVTITRGWWRGWFGYGQRVRVVRLKYGVAT